MPTALLRCDGGAEIGIGHVMRCRALAGALREMGWRTVFAMSARSARFFPGRNTFIVPAGNDGAAALRRAAVAEKAGCLVVDHYGLGEKFERAVASAVPVVVAIDDLANRKHHCDLLVDSNPAQRASDYTGYTTSATRLLLGARYALLRPEFRRLRLRGRKATRPQIKRVIIALGGADPENVSAKAIEAVADLRARVNARLIIGNANPNRRGLTARAKALNVAVAVDPPRLAAMMASADLAITGAGTMALEFACLGVPSLAIVVAENQRGVAQALEKAGAAGVLYNNDDLNARLLATVVAAIADDRNLRRKMSAAGRKLVDGRGAARVAREIAKLVTARKA